jgi:hypothetical protein
MGGPASGSLLLRRTGSPVVVVLVKIVINAKRQRMYV